MSPWQSCRHAIFGCVSSIIPPYVALGKEGSGRGGLFSTLVGARDCRRPTLSSMRSAETGCVERIARATRVSRYYTLESLLGCITSRGVSDGAAVVDLTPAFQQQLRCPGLSYLPKAIVGRRVLSSKDVISKASSDFCQILRTTQPAFSNSVSRPATFSLQHANASR